VSVCLSVCLSLCVSAVERRQGYGCPCSHNDDCRSGYCYRRSCADDQLQGVLAVQCLKIHSLHVLIFGGSQCWNGGSSQSRCRTRRCVTSSWLPSTLSHVTFVAVRPVISVLVEVTKQPAPPGPIIHLTALIITQLNSNEVINIAHRVLFIVRDGVD